MTYKRRRKHTWRITSAKLTKQGRQPTKTLSRRASSFIRVTARMTAPSRHHHQKRPRSARLSLLWLPHHWQDVPTTVRVMKIAVVPKIRAQCAPNRVHGEGQGWDAVELHNNIVDRLATTTHAMVHGLMDAIRNQG